MPKVQQNTSREELCAVVYTEDIEDNNCQKDRIAFHGTDPCHVEAIIEVFHSLWKLTCVALG